MFNFMTAIDDFGTLDIQFLFKYFFPLHGTTFVVGVFLFWVTYITEFVFASYSRFTFLDKKLFF